MSSEAKKVLRFQRDAIAIKRFRVYDLNGSTVFSLASATYELRKRSSGAVLKSGAATVNNADEDRAGNAIKTVSMTIDFTDTDELDLGAYYLLIHTVLDTQQTDFFRYPCELVDYRTKGVA